MILGFGVAGSLAAQENYEGRYLIDADPPYAEQIRRRVEICCGPIAEVRTDDKAKKCTAAQTCEILRFVIMEEKDGPAVTITTHRGEQLLHRPFQRDPRPKRQAETEEAMYKSISVLISTRNHIVYKRANVNWDKKQGCSPQPSPIFSDTVPLAESSKPGSPR